VYYHTLPLKYVVYGTILPHDDPSNQFRSAYEWLGHHCGYCPQIWLSRGDISMTGYRYRVGSVGISGSDQRAERDSVLFGFDLIHGFPIDYEFWWFHVLNTALNSPPGKDEIDRWLVDRLDWWLADSPGDRSDPTSRSFFAGTCSWSATRSSCHRSTSRRRSESCAETSGRKNSFEGWASSRTGWKSVRCRGGDGRPKRGALGAAGRLHEMGCLLKTPSLVEKTRRNGRP
jgi:hypothetical protein